MFARACFTTARSPSLSRDPSLVKPPSRHPLSSPLRSSTAAADGTAAAINACQGPSRISCEGANSLYGPLKPLVRITASARLSRRSSSIASCADRIEVASAIAAVARCGPSLSRSRWRGEESRPAWESRREVRPVATSAVVPRQQEAEVAQVEAKTGRDAEDGGSTGMRSTGDSGGSEAGGIDATEAAVMAALEQGLGGPLSREAVVPPPQPLVVVISGPSGVGKDAVIKCLQETRPDIHFVVTATSRERRAGEVDGKDYIFVSREEFEAMRDGGELLEHAVVYGEYKGIPKKQVRDSLARGTDVVLRIDVQGAATMRSLLGSSAVFVFLVAETEHALVQRLVRRKSESVEKLLVRVGTAREELGRRGEFDYVVVNADGQLEETVSTLCSIIDAEKLRAHRPSLLEL
ncbi:unnamed protein product [Closterium sp. NIES-64]|nr:unnamed protein product [Closterium sp. Naga37s-1]CAI5994085.1 unnamed protein product [Closterium sp. NIES-64]